MLVIQDELLHALLATFVDDWLKAASLVLIQSTLSSLDEFRSARFECLDVCA